MPLLSQGCGSRGATPAQQLGEHIGAHASEQDGSGQVKGARPGEVCP